MANEKPSRREALLEAAVRLIARNGVRGATVRAIAREAGITEGAVYRHFPSKEALYIEAYMRLMTDMIATKRRIADGDAPIAQKVREWVRVTLEQYDRHADAFTFVLLVPHELPPEHQEVTRRQGRILMEMLRNARDAGQMGALDTRLAVSHFTGIMLNVPRLVEEGSLDKPAAQYVDDVTAAICRALDIRE